MSHWATVFEVHLKSFESVESCTHEGCIIMFWGKKKKQISLEVISWLQNKMEPGAENKYE